MEEFGLSGRVDAPIDPDKFISQLQMEIRKPDPILGQEALCFAFSITADFFKSFYSSNF